MARIFPVVMAGGAGTRFWPLSRRQRPKQLLDLCDPGVPMVAATVARILPTCSAADVLIVTGREIADDIARAVPAVPRENVLAEPVGRNTAPCVGWAALHVRRRDAEGVMAVLPADHAVARPEAFRDALRRAVAACDDGTICTIGVTPSGPETGYGYIEVGRAVGAGVHEAVRFVEKPDLATALGYLASGAFAWNSGMFFFKAKTILAEIERSMPGLHEALAVIDAGIATGAEASAVDRVYEGLASESIDYGIMEKAERILVCPAEFGWSDLGSWAAAYEKRASVADEHGNVALADLIALDAAGCLAWAEPRKVVALVGVHDLVVVDTPDALLVCSREKAQDVKRIVDTLKARGSGGLL
jgi:mannose-1-phosphate guanylyltransferase